MTCEFEVFPRIDLGEKPFINDMSHPDFDLPVWYPEDVLVRRFQMQMDQPFLHLNREPDLDFGIEPDLIVNKVVEYSYIFTNGISQGSFPIDELQSVPFYTVAGDEVIDVDINDSWDIKIVTRAIGFVAMINAEGKMVYYAFPMKIRFYDHIKEEEKEND